MLHPKPPPAVPSTLCGNQPPSYLQALSGALRPRRCQPPVSRTPVLALQQPVEIKSVLLLSGLS